MERTETQKLIVDMTRDELRQLRKRSDWIELALEEMRMHLAERIASIEIPESTQW